MVKMNEAGDYWFVLVAVVQFVNGGCHFSSSCARGNQIRGCGTIEGVLDRRCDH